MTSTDVDLKPLVLPYFHVVTGQSGWQFGLPVAQHHTGLKKAMARKADVSILILLEDGSSFREDHPILSRPKRLEQSTLAPRPAWAWVAFDLDDGLEYARVRAPKPAFDCVPLSGLPDRVNVLTNTVGPIIYSADVPHYYDMPATAYDILPPISTVNSEELPEDGLFTIALGSTSLADILVNNNRVIGLAPSDWSINNGLWTAHLVRLMQIVCQPEPYPITG